MSFARGAAFKSLLAGSTALLALATAAGASDLRSTTAAPWSWAGLYVGAHMGGGLGQSHVDNPYGPTLFGDTVRSPGPLVGAQIGYDWQTGPWVFGAQADIAAAKLDGTFTCLQSAHAMTPLPPDNIPGFLGGAYGATCQVEPRWLGTLTGRVGIATGANRDVLLYAKGGLAWMQGTADIAINNIRADKDGPANAMTSSRFDQWGFVVGAGLEYALGGHWSAMAEYDYLSFAGHDLATPDGGFTRSPLPGINGALAPDGRTTSLSQAIHEFKLGVNYRFGDRTAPMAAAPAGSARLTDHLQVELGARYVYGWGRYKQDLGGGSPPPVNNSRLTWTDLQTDGGELFGRVELPKNFVVKGFLGRGNGDHGHMNDEDWGLAQPIENGVPVQSVFAYQNSLSDASTKIRYFTVDAGYDWFREPNYRFTVFAGYSQYKQTLVTPKTMSYVMYAPASPSGAVGLGQDSLWRAVRLGAAADVVLLPRLHLGVEAAYLPYVRYRGEDDHGPGAVSPMWGDGTGVQLEAIVSYDVTDKLNVGVGGRYWAYWVPEGKTANFSNGGTGGVDEQTFAAEQAAVFLQASYKLGLF
jgi:opacity protein-like surface antigen